MVTPGDRLPAGRGARRPSCSSTGGPCRSRASTATTTIPTGQGRDRATIMRADVVLMKRHNINAVRTLALPERPASSTTCATSSACTWSTRPTSRATPTYAACATTRRWTAARGSSASRAWSQRDKNHPSIIMWSLGNESGLRLSNDDGARRLAPRLRPDPAGALRGGIGDYAVARRTGWASGGRDGHRRGRPMYPAIDDLVDWAAGPGDRPLIMCEYIHAMGNSRGSLADYWAGDPPTPVCRAGSSGTGWTRPAQRLPDGTERLAYGGDFGDEPNDGNFVCDGLDGRGPRASSGARSCAGASAGRRHRPVTVEQRHGRWPGASLADQPAVRSPRGLPAGAHGRCASTVTLVAPRHACASASSRPDQFGRPWCPFRAPARTSAGVRSEVAPAVVRFETRRANGRGLTGRSPGGVGSDPLRTAPHAGGWRACRGEGSRVTTVVAGCRPMPVELAVDGGGGSPRRAGAAEPVRAATDNDGFKLLPELASGSSSEGRALARWLELASTPSSPPSELVRHSVRRGRRRAPLAASCVVTHFQRIDVDSTGITFTEVVWLPPELEVFPGSGRPAASRRLRAGALVRARPARVLSRSQRQSATGRGLGPAGSTRSPYLVPQEFGLRTDCRWFELGGPGVGGRAVRVEGLGRRCTAQPSTTATRPVRRPLSGLELTPARWSSPVDTAHRGVGTASCGPDVLDRHRLRAGTYSWRSPAVAFRLPS